MTAFLRDLPAACFLTLGFGTLIVMADLWKKRLNPPGEWTRKLVHVGGGLLCALFPFLLHSPWTVGLLAMGLSGFFIAARHTRLLPGLNSVTRTSRGSEYYPLSILLVFLLSSGTPWLFMASVLVLALADAGAALAGGRWGRFQYTVEDNNKSVEGSLTFLSLAFLAIFIPCSAMSDLPKAVCALSALIVALILTGLEAISLEGADNLFVPVGAWYILSKITTKSPQEISYQLLSFVCLAILVGIIAWSVKRFNTGGALTVLLMLFAAWSLGSEHWALPLGLALGFFLLVSLGIPSSSGSGTLRVRLVFQALVVPLGFLVVANATSLYATFFSPFVASINVVLLFLLRRHLSPPRRSLVWILVFISSIVMTTGLTWWIGPGQSGWILSVLILVIAVGGLMGGFLHPAKDRSKLHWGQLATIAGCGLVMLYLQWLSLPAWMPQEAFPASWP